MIKTLHDDHVFSDFFLRFLLARGMKTQADLVTRLTSISVDACNTRHQAKMGEALRRIYPTDHDPAESGRCLVNPALRNGEVTGGDDVFCAKEPRRKGGGVFTDYLFISGQSRRRNMVESDTSSHGLTLGSSSVDCF
jgi:hypothetical protein